MFFHYVKQGDSLSSLSKQYAVSISDLVQDNQLSNPNNLSVGQCLIINKRSTMYTIKEGDTLAKLSKRFHLSIDEIKENNKNLTEPLKVGSKIKIVFLEKDKHPIEVNGYSYSTINKNTLLNSLKYLTYLSIFSYTFNEDGTLNKINEDSIIDDALKYDVAPIMVIANISKKGGFSTPLANKILESDTISENLFSNIMDVLKEKKYYGVNFDFEYISPKNKDAYVDFIRKAKAYFSKEGFMVSVALASKYSSTQEGLLYTAHDYERIGKYADRIMLMTYEWGYTYSEAMAVSPLDRVKQVIDYAVTVIPREKILMGIPNYGYDFLKVNKDKKAAKGISYQKAIDLAFEKKSEIKRNEKSQTPYYSYVENGETHEVHFDDACSFYKKLELMENNNIGGISIWTINTNNNPYYTLLDYFFEIEKKL